MIRFFASRKKIDFACYNYHLSKFLIKIKVTTTTIYF